MEETRLVRAFYRFQLCCNLFGTNRVLARQPPAGRRLADIFVREEELFTLYEPWEIEEVVCVYEFAKDKFDEIFSRIYWDVHRINPKFADQRCARPVGSFDLDDEGKFVTISTDPTFSIVSNFVLTSRKKKRVPGGKYLLRP